MRQLFVLLATLLMLCFSGATQASDEFAGATQKSLTVQNTAPDDLWRREKLVPDLLGARIALADCGIAWQGQLTQFHQSVAAGGANEAFRYGGKLDQFVFFDFEKIGLGQNLKAVMHVESRFGQSAIADAVISAPVNTAMLLPELGESGTAITSLIFEMGLSEEWALLVGRINSLDLWAQVYPQAGRGVDGFMNISVILPLTHSRTFPLVTNGAGLLKRNEERIQGSLMVFDSKSSPTDAGLDDLFDNGANLLGLWRIFTSHGGQPASHAVIGTWATGEFTALDPVGMGIIPVVPVVAPRHDNSWSANYIYEQQLWADPCKEHRKLGLLAQCGFADARTSPYDWVTSISLQGQGLLAGREYDRLGVGCFYNSLSNQLQNLLQPFSPLQDTYGAEVYYNARLTRWFSLTTDLQVIEPAVIAQDTAVVFGIRGRIDL